MQKLSSRSLAVRKAIENRKSFDTYGALRARYYGPGSCTASAGLLRGPDNDTFWDRKHEITYVAFSYNTPIFWWYEDGTSHRIAQKFSVTTSRHKGACPRGTNEGGLA